MRTRWGAIVAASALMVAGMTGCTSVPGGSPGPTSTAGEQALPSQPADPPSEASSGAPDAAAKARAHSWLENLPIPPAAQRVDASPSSAFDTIGTTWMCQPMAVESAYWVVKGMSLVETTNWMIAHPSPGLITSPHGVMSESQDAEGDMTNFGQTPEPHDPYEGIFIVVAKIADGSAIHAEAGTYPESAICQTPEPGTSFGGIGQG